jgi:hypothetical protein
MNKRAEQPRSMKAKGADSSTDRRKFLITTGTAAALFGLGQSGGREILLAAASEPA